MDPEAEEALRELEQGERWASHPPRQEQQTACDAPQLPNFAILCSTLQEILKGVDVTSATFGQVRIELARRLKVTEEALEPCRQQLGDIVKGFLEQPNAIPKSADRPVKSWRNHYGGVWSHTGGDRHGLTWHMLSTIFHRHRFVWLEDHSALRSSHLRVVHGSGGRGSSARAGAG